MISTANLISEDNTKLVVEQGGVEYTFYKGDENFAKCPGVNYSASKLARLTSHTARRKINGKVYWWAEAYFADIVAQFNTFKPRKSTKTKATGKQKTNQTPKKLHKSQFECVNGGKQ